MVKVKVVFWKSTELVPSVIVRSQVEAFLERKPESGQSPVLSCMIDFLSGGEFEEYSCLH
jgi:hypothetical protein